MCFDDDARPPIPLSDNSGARGEDVSLTAADGNRFNAYLASPEGAADAQVLILPDVRGLHTFYRELALRFADIGIRALVIDYFGRTAADEPRDDSFEYMAHVQQMTRETFAADLDAALEHLRSGDGVELATFTLGFCMGGSLSFWAGTHDRDLAGVVGFYAGLLRHFGAVMPAAEYATAIKVPLLGLFGGADEGIPQSAIDDLDRMLTANGTEHEIVVYPGAPHSFFDRRATDFAQASADAWSRVQGFIAAHRPTPV
jgi:carboxymethylenebutenolidase